MIFTLAAVLAVTPVMKPVIEWQPPESTDDDRPLMSKVIVTASGSDYSLKLEFDKAPFGEACRNRCANATVFIDTDNDKQTGVKLQDATAAENGADLVVVIQGVRELRNESPTGELRILVKQFSEDATSLDGANLLTQLDPRHDSERVTVSGTKVTAVIDANLGNLPAGKKLRVVYHPPEHGPMVAVTGGLLSPAGRVELFKGGKRSNPAKSITNGR